MKRAGYLSRDGREVLDAQGIPCEVVDLYIHGARLSISIDELRDAIERGALACVRRVKQNWMEYFWGEAGRAGISRSGKALNIELVNGDRFTLSLASLRGILSYQEKNAPIMELPSRVPPKVTRNHVLADFSGPVSPCPA
ncbi:MAG: hypothetical protein NQU46_00665 [Methanolinea sp.]|nr:hypothetical protein [Methanolinea sp.]